MKRYVLMTALAVAAAGCSSDSPTSPTGPPTTMVFTAAVSPANEVPPITNADASARGTGTFTLNLTRDGAGAITVATGTFVFSLTGFPAGTVIRLTHIHDRGPGIIAPVVVNSDLSAANAITLANGSIGDQTFANNAVGATLAQQIINNPNGFTSTSIRR